MDNEIGIRWFLGFLFFGVALLSGWLDMVFKVGCIMRKLRCDFSLLFYSLYL